MAKIRGLAVMLAFAVVGGCGESKLPMQPAPVPQTPTPPQPPVVVPMAASELILSNLGLDVVPFIRPSDGQPLFWYAPRFRLTENSGLSGATVKRVTVSLGWDEGDPYGQDCWGTQIRVPPHGISEAFGDNRNALGRCAPGIARRDESSDAFIDVVFVDDLGREGTAFGRAIRK